MSGEWSSLKSQIAVLNLAAVATAITVIPGTPSIVVAVITEAVSDELRSTTETLDFLYAFVPCVLKSTVQALTVFAILVVILMTAAISSIWAMYSRTVMTNVLYALVA